MRKVATILQQQPSYDGYNLGSGFDLDHTTGSEHRKLRRLFEQKFYGLFEHMSLAFSLKASEAGSIVCTIAAGKCALYYSRPDSRNYCPAVSRNQKIQVKLLHDGFSLYLETSSHNYQTNC